MAWIFGVYSPGNRESWKFFISKVSFMVVLTLSWKVILTQNATCRHNSFIWPTHIHAFNIDQILYQRHSCLKKHFYVYIYHTHTHMQLYTHTHKHIESHISFHSCMRHSPHEHTPIVLARSTQPRCNWQEDQSQKLANENPGLSIHLVCIPKVSLTLFFPCLFKTGTKKQHHHYAQST